MHEDGTVVKVDQTAADISTWRGYFKPDPVTQLPTVPGKSAKMAILGVSIGKSTGMLVKLPNFVFYIPIHFHWALTFSMHT